MVDGWMMNDDALLHLGCRHNAAHSIFSYDTFAASGDTISSVGLKLEINQVN